MADNHAEWISKSWNPITGCSPHSPGCMNCYARQMAVRLKAIGQAKYSNGFQVTCHPSALDEPLSWKKPQSIFTCSMADLFHADVPDDFIQRIFAVMAEAMWHEFTIITKRAERLAQLAPKLPWPRNLAAGVTVEDAPYAYRADYLRQVPAAVRFLMLEPLLGPIPNLNLDNIHLVVVGGESGRNARGMHIEWVRGIRDQCIAAGVPFNFKQWGGMNREKAGRSLDGLEWTATPVHRAVTAGGRAVTAG